VALTDDCCVVVVESPFIKFEPPWVLDVTTWVIVGFVTKRELLLVTGVMAVVNDCRMLVREIWVIEIDETYIVEAIWVFVGSVATGVTSRRDLAGMIGLANAEHPTQETSLWLCCLGHKPLVSLAVEKKACLEIWTG
jgi:hypothetical protein